MEAAPVLRQPLTFGGAAGFARAPFSRLLLFQLFFAALAAGAVVSAFRLAWAPSIREAIAALPKTGRILDGQLEWPAPSPVRLSDRKFLAILVDTANSGALNQASDLQCKFTAAGVELHSWLGYASFPYPKGYATGFNQPELEPWWGAWQQPIQLALAAGTVVYLLVCWWTLSCLYVVPVAIITLLTRRSASLAGCWKLANAALLPGALLMSAAIAAYGLGKIDLMQFAFASLLHFVVGWIYLCFSPLRLPKAGSPDPFGQPEPESEKPSPPPKKKNPFIADHEN